MPKVGYESFTNWRIFFDMTLMHASLYDTHGGDDQVPYSYNNIEVKKMWFFKYEWKTFQILSCVCQELWNYATTSKEPNVGTLGLVHIWVCKVNLLATTIYDPLFALEGLYF